MGSISWKQELSIGRRTIKTILWMEKILIRPSTLQILKEDLMPQVEANQLERLFPNISLMKSYQKLCHIRIDPISMIHQQELLTINSIMEKKSVQTHSNFSLQTAFVSQWEIIHSREEQTSCGLKYQAIKDSSNRNYSSLSLPRSWNKEVLFKKGKRSWTLCKITMWMCLVMQVISLNSTLRLINWGIAVSSISRNDSFLLIILINFQFNLK